MSQSPSQSQSGGRANGNASAGDPIRLTMAGQDGSRVVYRIPRKCKFFKLFKDYCQKKNLDYHTARFLLNGHRIQGKYTPEKLKLQDGEEIYCVFNSQHGGGFDIIPSCTS